MWYTISQRMENPVRVDREGPDGIVVVRLDRPGSRNALDGPTVEALIEAFSDDAARAIVLGSTDPRSFSSGADTRLADDERAALSDRLYELYARMLRNPAPIVAAVAGPAVGGGAQLAVASDLRVAAPDAFFRFAGPGHGLAVGAWGLPSLVGRGRALDLCLTMRPVGAEEALAIGLVDRVDAEPETAALGLATALAQLDAGAAARVKRIAGDAERLLAALELERSGNAATWSGSLEGA